MLSSASQRSSASENSSLGNNNGHHSFAQPLQPVLKPSLRLVTQHFPSLCQVSDALADFKAVGCPVGNLGPRADKVNNHSGKLGDSDASPRHEIEIFPEHAAIAFKASRDKLHYSRQIFIGDGEIPDLLAALKR